MNIKVFHPFGSARTYHTEFNGPDVRYVMENSGALRITTWVNDTHEGHALFAPGEWSHIIASYAAD